MRRKSIRAALFWFALLALGLQLAALPISTGHQAAKLASGLDFICTPFGMNWVASSNGKTQPVEPSFFQFHCPHCNVGQHTPALASAQINIGNTSKPFLRSPVTRIRLDHAYNDYLPANPRGPPALLHI